MVEDGKKIGNGEGSRATIVLNASEFLAVGQNLLDQEPFNLAINRIAQGKGVDPALLRGILLLEAEAPETWLGQRIGENARLYYFTERLARFRGIPITEIRPKRKTLVEAYRELVTSLRLYPRWKEYVEEQFDPSFYDYTGDWNKRHRVQPELDVSRSYASWLDITLRAEKSGRTWGIQEVFPQDFKHETPPLRPEKAPALRRWVILAASEIGSK